MSNEADHSGSSAQQGPPPPKGPPLRGFLSLLGLAIFLLVLAGGAVWVQGFRTPEIILTLLLVVGVVALLLALGGFAELLPAKSLSRAHALGLPEGSIRAVIALSLILIFAMVAVYLYTDAAHVRVLSSVGISADQVALLPQSQIVAIRAGAAPGTYDVDVAQAATDAGNQIGLQLVTILGTLVTAVAAFYFGASSTREANAAGHRQSRSALPPAPAAPTPDNTHDQDQAQ